MTLIEKIKFLFSHKTEIKAVEGAAKDLKAAVEANGGPKSSLKSGEFYLVAIPILQQLLGVFHGHMPDKAETVTVAVLAGAFAALRTYLKK
jgi:hypothetical protein